MSLTLVLQPAEPIIDVQTIAYQHSLEIAAEHLLNHLSCSCPLYLIITAKHVRLPGIEIYCIVALPNNS